MPDTTPTRTWMPPATCGKTDFAKREEIGCPVSSRSAQSAGSGAPSEAQSAIAPRLIRPVRRGVLLETRFASEQRNRGRPRASVLLERRLHINVAVVVVPCGHHGRRRTAILQPVLRPHDADVTRLVRIGGCEGGENELSRIRESHGLRQDAGLSAQPQRLPTRFLCSRGPPYIPSH